MPRTNQILLLPIGMYALVICRTHPFLILYKGLEHDLKVSWNGDHHTASAYSGNQGYQNNLTKTRRRIIFVYFFLKKYEIYSEEITKFIWLLCHWNSMQLRNSVVQESLK